jgi:hypothetical protein
LCSHRLIAKLIENPPELQFGQEVIHGNLQCLHYDLVDIHKLSLQIDEVIEFPRRLNVKQILENLVWKLGCIALFGPFKQIIPDLDSFLDLHTCRKSLATISLLRVWSN